MFSIFFLLACKSSWQ